jgi:zinc protease
LKAFKKKLRFRNRHSWAKVASILICLTMAVTTLAANLNAASVTEGAGRFRLENGLTLILKEDHSAEVAAIQVWLKTGSANETDEEAGITHLIEHMMFKGTPSRKTGEIARTIETAGGSINAYTSLDRTVYHIQIPSTYFDTGINILLDAIQNSLFDPAELEREKEVVLEEYRRALDIPRTRFGWAMMDLCYRKHPYRRPVIGYEATIRSFKRKDILNYIEKWFTPDNMVLVAVGDFDSGRALKVVKGFFKEPSQRQAHRRLWAPEPAQSMLRKMVLEDDIQQVYIDMSWHIPHLAHPDIPILEVLEIVMANGKSSRLYKRLKMEKNLVHGISAGTSAMLDPGLFSVDATLSPEKFKTALYDMVQEVNGITLAPVSEAELTRAKTIAEADFLFNMETMSGQASTLGFFQTMTGDVYKADDYLKRLKQVTLEDIQNAVKTYFRPENLSIGVMAPKTSQISLSAEEITALFAQALTTPPPGPAPQARDAKAIKIVLPNGMRLIIKENHTLPVVSFTGAFLGGTRLEVPPKWGISDFSASMLTRGTSERTASEIASTVESHGGRIDGFSGRNSFGLSARFLSKDIYLALELLADMVLNSVFPESEIEKVREDILADIKAKEDRPVRQLFDLFYETLFKHHPYGHPATGTSQSIRSIKRSDLLEWYRTLSMPSNFVLAVVGDVNKNDLIPFIKTLFVSRLIPSPKKLPHIPPEPILPASREAHLERPGAQTHLLIGYLGADLKSKDNAPMTLIKTSLSGQGGRLFYNLRDKKSLAYSVAAFRNPGLETGVFAVYLACDPKKVPVAEQEIFKQLHDLRETGISQEELEAAKAYFLGILRISLQTNESQAMHMALDELYGLGHEYIQGFIKEIESVTLKDIKRSAQDIILPGRFVFATVGPTRGTQQ